MQIRISVRSLLTLSTLMAVACADSGNAPYPSGDSYYADSVEGSDASSYGGGGSAWLGGGASGARADAASADAGSVASGNEAGVGPADGPDVVLRSGALFDGYLANAEGRALYMFANDVPGSGESACIAACLDKWPAFDAKDINVGEGLNVADFSRFQRPDGTWQSTFKGHPLYYFSVDAGSVTGDGMGGRWFVARDYFAFVAAKPDLTPQGAAAPAPYLTNRLGRTLYIFMSDSAGNASTPPVSACSGGCLDSWPPWTAPASLDNLLLPSSMDAADFDQFERVVGGATVKQLTYRGWPLYFYATDDAPGETSGHLTGAWRAIDPTAFADGVTFSNVRTGSRAGTR
jgi:predicted lipoprotein with Yx(FWY)xxD motif